MSDVRDPIQADLVDMYLMTDRRRATMVLSTGIGKSKIALDIIKKLTPSHTYIVVESADLRDFSWKREFIKHGREPLLEKYVTIVTYQMLTRRMQIPVSIDENAFIIFDEVDFMAGTDVYARAIDLFPNSRILGLTGFVTEEKKWWFEQNLPILINVTPKEAQDNGFLNKIKFVFVKYDLSLDPEDHEVKYKAKNGEMKSFRQSENKSYEYEHRKFLSLNVKKGISETRFKHGDITYGEYEREQQNLDYKIKYCINRRQELLFNSISTAGIARKLLSYVERISPDSKTLVFSKRTKQVDAVVGEDRAYHGKIDKDIARLTFEAFNAGEIKVMGTCQKVNRGINIDNLNYGLMETFIGSDTMAVQKFGRLMRLNPDDEATCFVLLPYYMQEQDDKTYTSEPTQQVEWASNMLRSTNITNSVVWDYRQIKTE